MAASSRATPGRAPRRISSPASRRSRARRPPSCRTRRRCTDTLREKGEAMARLAIPQSVAEWNERGREYLPGRLGMEILAVEPDEVRARIRVERGVCAWNGFLHAGAVVSLADTCCGYATARNLPEDAEGFTTIELQSHLIGSHL